MRQLLRSKHWDSRVAAGDCLGLIAEHCIHHTAADLLQAAPAISAVKSELKAERDGGPGESPEEGDAPLSFQNFDIDRVMTKGSVLLASGGTVRPPHPLIANNYLFYLPDLHRRIYACIY